MSRHQHGHYLLHTNTHHLFSFGVYNIGSGCHGVRALSAEEETLCGVSTFLPAERKSETTESGFR